MDEVAPNRARAEKIRELGEVEEPVRVPRRPIRVVAVGDPVDRVVRLGRLVEQLGDPSLGRLGLVYVPKVLRRVSRC